MKVNVKIWSLFLLGKFNLRKEQLFSWLLLDCTGRRGTAKTEECRDKEKEAKTVVPVSNAVLRKLLADNYVETVTADIAKLEAEVGRSIFDIFDDNVVFAKFSHLKSLARNKEFEKKYYGKVR